MYPEFVAALQWVLNWYWAIHFASMALSILIIFYGRGWRLKTGDIVISICFGPFLWALLLLLAIIDYWDEIIIGKEKD